MFSNPFNVSTLIGTNGFKIPGIAADDKIGKSISSAGDINGDNINDLIIGAPFTSIAELYSGSSYIIFGSKTIGATGSVSLSTLDGTNGFTFNGDGVISSVGWSVSFAGDINGDSTNDIIVGAPYTSNSGISYSGKTYIIFGSKTIGSSATLDPSDLNGTNGFSLNAVANLDFAGYSVSSAGDVNGDNIKDIIIGAPLSGATNSGSSYIIFGSTTIGSSGSIELSALTGTNGVTLSGISENEESGKSVSSAGDLNGDKIRDIIIGAPKGLVNSVATGRAYVVFGSKNIDNSATIDLSTLDGTNGFTLDGAADGDYTGISVSSAGDVNGDVFDDIIIGAPRADSYYNVDSGASYIIFGSKIIGNTGSIDLSSLDGAHGFILKGVAAGDRSGIRVSSAGDVNGDGLKDIFIGGYNADVNGLSNVGESYVVFGSKTIGSSGSFDLLTLDGTNGFTVTGIAGYDVLGSSVSFGDVNGDNGFDLIVGAPGRDANGLESAGSTYVIFGTPQLKGLGEKTLLSAGKGFTDPAVAKNFADGTAFIVSESKNSAGTSGILIAQKVKADGSLNGSSVTLSLGATGGTNQLNPSVVAVSGGYVVVWQEINSTTKNNEIYRAFYNNNGAAINNVPPIQLNTLTANSQDSPALCKLSNGEVVVVWKHVGFRTDSVSDIVGQVLNPVAKNFTRKGPNFLVSTPKATNENPSIAALAPGGFVVAWDKLTAGVNGQIFSSTLTKIGTLITFQDTAVKTNPVVSLLTNNNWVMAFESKATGQKTKIRARIYSKAGAAVTAIFDVSSGEDDPVGDQFAPSVTGLADGTFVIGWHQSATSSTTGLDVYARRFNEDGKVRSDTFLLNSVRTGAQSNVIVVSTADLRFLSVWQSKTGSAVSEVHDQSFSFVSATTSTPVLSAIVEARERLSLRSASNFGLLNNNN